MMRAFQILGVILLIGVLGVVVVLVSVSDARPEGQPGAEADALARALEDAVGKDAWERTGAVRWSFFERHHYVWDRARGLVELRWGESRALFRTHDQSGRVWKEGAELNEADAAAALRTADA